MIRYNKKIRKYLTVTGIFLVFFILMSVVGSAEMPDGISCKSYVEIFGNSNVNRFEFVLNFRGNQDFALRQADSARPEDKSYSIYIPVKQFEADNKLIYRDFLTMLKADQYPYIIIKIPVAHLEKVLAGKVCTEHSIKITIDGVTNSYNVPGTAVNCREGRVYVTGLQNIKLTDFDISPPEKFFGMIRVKNEISVSFGFVFMV